MASVASGARRAVNRHAVLAVASLGVFMEFVDSTIVNIAFPSIHRSFADSTLSTLSWIFNAYSIVFAAFLVVSGRLADLFGRRKLFRSGVAVFTISSALCGLAPSSGFLIAMRACQALGGAMVVPSSMALVIEAYPPSEREEATTIYGATAALAAALGPPIGGLLIGIANWRLCFFVNVPVGLAVLALSSPLLVESRTPGRRLIPDLGGAALFGAGIALLTLGIVRGTDWGWGSGRIVGSFVLAALAISWFGWRSSWHRAPIVDPALVRQRSFVAVSSAMLLSGTGFYGYLLCNALFLILVWHYSVLVAGLTFVPGALVAAITSAASRKLAERAGFAALIVPGAICWAAGMVWFWRVVGVHPAWASQWLPGTIITGVGAGLVLPALGAAAIAATPGRGYAMSGALNTTARQLGAALGIAIIVVLIGRVPGPTSLRHGWIFAGGCFAAVVLLGAVVGRLRPAAEIPAEDADARPPAVHLVAETEPPAQAVDAPDPVETVQGDEIAAFVRSVPIFAGIGADLQDRITQIAEVVKVGAGEYVFRRGDPVDGLYVVRAGRVDVLFEDHGRVSRRELGRGEVLGELALLAEPRRSATVQARRDTELIRIPRAEFELLMQAGPELAAALNARLAGLLQRTRLDGSPARLSPSTIAVIGAGDDALRLASDLESQLDATVFTVETGESVGDRAALLDRAERERAHVLLVAKNGAPASWQDFCIRQADAVVLAASGAPPARLAVTNAPKTIVLPNRDEIRAWARAFGRDVETVTAGPNGAAAVARRYAGHSVGLVLSGGGARALAHVGVIEELQERGLTVDRVAAAGTGALIAAMLASGWTAAEIDARCYQEFVRRNPFSGYRLRRTSLIGSERVATMLGRLFGDTWIEELPLQFVCVSADLVRGERVEHRRGPVAEALLAAVTMPGLMAPVPDGDRLLVDAGGIDNLPIDTLAAAEGPIVAVDVAPRERGPERVQQSRRPGRRRPAVAPLPTVAEALARTLVLGSCEAAEAARRAAAVSIVPDTSGVGMFEFHQLDVLRAAGRAAARRALADTEAG